MAFSVSSPAFWGPEWTPTGSFQISLPAGLSFTTESVYRSGPGPLVPHG